MVRWLLFGMEERGESFLIGFKTHVAPHQTLYQSSIGFKVFDGLIWHGRGRKAAHTYEDVLKRHLHLSILNREIKMPLKGLFSWFKSRKSSYDVAKYGIFLIWIGILKDFFCGHVHEISYEAVFHFKRSYLISLLVMIKHILWWLKIMGRCFTHLLFTYK